MTSQKFWLPGLLSICSVMEMTAFAAEPPSVEKTMTVKPSQADVEYETPKPAEFAKCKLEVERKGKINGWIVLGPSGQVLRKFLDTDGDGKLDQYRFFNHGIEVYRDMDTNHNGKIDQCRWLNRGGSRWGVDLNEDGRIEQWKVLSAAEASKEAIRAMVTGDAIGLQAVMVNADDLKAIGMNAQLATKVLESASDPAKKAKAIMEKSKVMTPQARWSRFDAPPPNIIPADDEKSKEDLQIYETANAIIETPRKDPSKVFDAVQIGEIIRIGEVWKLTQVPLPIEGEPLTISPVLMEPLQIASAGAATSQGPSPKVEKILKDLQDIDQRVLQPNQASPQIKNLMAKRATLLKDAIELAETDEEKTFLTKQNVDGLAIAAQMGSYADGVADLRVIEEEIASKTPNSPLLPYTSYRLIQAEYTVNSQSIDEKDDKKEKQAEIQKTWLDALAAFVEKYPTSDDADDAMFNLGNHEEFQGRTNEAITWYQRIVTDRPKSELAARSQGALRRLKLNNQPLQLEGPLLSGGTLDVKSLKGKVVLVVFWNSEFKLCAEDVPQLRALYEANKAKGFEIVGVPVEPDKASVSSFVKSNNMSWPQIFQAPAANQSSSDNNLYSVQYGVISFPTMFLVNKDGKVVSRNVALTEVKSDLPELLKGTNVAQNPQKSATTPSRTNTQKPK